MAWERRGPGGNRYYYRCRWIHGRNVKTYMGRGRLALVAAQEDEAQRAGRLAQQYAAEIEKALEKPVRELVTELDGLVNVAIYSALTAAGYHRHERGRWRKQRRGKANQAAHEAGNRE